MLTYLKQPIAVKMLEKLKQIQSIPLHEDWQIKFDLSAQISSNIATQGNFNYICTKKRKIG